MSSKNMSETSVKLTRRSLLGAGLCLTFAFSLGMTGCSSPRDPKRGSLNAWIAIYSDGKIEIISPAAESGNGSFTALPLIVCEELDGDWTQVVPVAPLGEEPTLYGNPAFNGMLYTAGSTTVEYYFDSLRIAGAQARRVLINAVAKEWAVPANSLETQPSLIVHAESGRKMAYGDAIALVDVAAALPQIKETDLKSPANFRLIGKDVGRSELPAKVNGTAKYGMDVDLPDMVYAMVEQGPYHGAKPLSFNSAEVRKIAGIIQTVSLPNGVAVVANSLESAKKGREVLEVEWSVSPGASYNSAGLHDAYAIVAKDKMRSGHVWDQAGDVGKSLASARKVYTREYRSQALCHMQMEPINATAVIGKDGQSVDIYCGSQSMSNGINAIAAATGFERSKIKFHQQFLGGGFGRRTQHEAAVDAVLIAKVVKRPVKLIWSREDDVKGARFFPALLHWEEAGIDQDGNIIGWHQRIVGDSVLEFIRPGLLEQSGKEAVVMKTTELQGYDVPNKLAEFLWERHDARLATYRGVGAAPNRFAIESFVDEIAHDLKLDPVQYRLQLAHNDERALGVIRAVAEMSKWGREASPGSGFGVAYSNKDGTYCAAVVEVSVDQASGVVKIVNAWLAIDAGRAVQPKNIIAQTEGGFIFAMGRTLMEELTIENGVVTQSNYYDYLVPRLQDIPNIAVRVMESEHPPCGAGEDGACVAAPAVANAVFNATGARIRQLPLTPERVLAHLQS